MRALYLLSVWLHILAAITWIGGMFFLVIVVVPWLRQGKNRASAGTLLQDTGRRFRSVGWICFGLLVATGVLNLWTRGVRVADFGDAAWRSSPFGKAVLVKLSLFVIVVIVSAVHDFSVGPRASMALARNAQSSEAQNLRRQASLLGRLNVLLALLLVAVGVVLVRGWP